MMFPKRLLLFLWFLGTVAVHAQVPDIPAMPEKISSREYVPPPPTPLVMDETKAQRPLDISAIFSKVDSRPIPVTPGELPLELRASTLEIKFVERLRKADMDFQQGKYAVVIAELEKILIEMPTDRGVRMLLSAAYQQNRQYAKAEKLYKELIAEFPKDYILSNNLAWMYATAQDPAYRRADEAVRLARMAMVLAPADHHVWSTLSAAYYSDGEYDRALTAARQALFQVQKLGTPDQLLTYSEQVDRCQKAVRTMSILE